MCFHKPELRRSGRFTPFDIQDISRNITATADWNPSFQIPDIIGFEDYKNQAGAQYVLGVGSSSDYKPEPLVTFPYPKGAGKLRPMAVAHVADIVLSRIDAGRIARITDPQLSDRVLSWRIAQFDTPKEAWAFQPSASAWKKFTKGSIPIIDRGDRPIMCRTDITEFYPSVALCILELQLFAANCDSAAVTRLLRMFEFWHESSNLRGLPIGLQASSVVSNFFLNPVDRALERAGLLHRRYGDDMLIFTENSQVNRVGVELLDKRLDDLRLTRSVEKTDIFDDPNKAKANLRDAETDYLASCQRILPAGVATYVLERAFDRDILTAQKINASRLRYILKALKGKGQRYRTLDLARRFDIMNLDPKNTTEYLIDILIPLEDSEKTDRCGVVAANYNLWP
jgi:Reverse transcriptase (RNA-dependent DNA polymerase)